MSTTKYEHISVQPSDLLVDRVTYSNQGLSVHVDRPGDLLWWDGMIMRVLRLRHSLAGVEVTGRISRVVSSSYCVELERRYEVGDIYEGLIPCGQMLRIIRATLTP